MGQWTECQACHRKIFLDSSKIKATASYVIDCWFETEPGHTECFINTIFTAFLLGYHHERDSAEKIMQEVRTKYKFSCVKTEIYYFFCYLCINNQFICLSCSFCYFYSSIFYFKVQVLDMTSSFSKLKVILISKRFKICKSDVIKYNKQR